MTGPWAPDTADALTRPLSHIARAHVTTAEGELIDLEVTGGTVTFDENRAPRASADGITCRLPSDAAQVARIDPRTGARLVIEAGYLRTGNTRDIHPLGDLGLRRSRRRRASGELILTAAGDEALIVDNSPSIGGSAVGADVVAAIEDVIDDILTPATLEVDVTTVGPATNLSPQGDKWQAIDDLADRINADVYDDGLRGWHIVDRPELGASVYRLTCGRTGTITSIDSDIDRNEFYNRVVLTYEWTDTGGTDHKIVVEGNATGPFAPSGTNIRTFVDTRDTPTDTTAAQLAADTLATRLANRGRGFAITAPSAYWVRPGLTVTVVDAGHDPEDQLVASVTFDLKAGLMSLVTRYPE